MPRLTSSRTPGMSQVRSSANTHRDAAALAGLLAGASILHLVRPAIWHGLIPEQLPGSPDLWIKASGVVELGCAAAVALPRTRGFGGLAAALLLVGILPGNVKVAMDAGHRGKPAAYRAAMWARLPLQWPLVALALRIRDSAR